MNTFAPSNTNAKLTAWHEKQAAMLYYFTSLDYLKSLRRMVTDLLDGVVDPLLDTARSQNRDQVLVTQRWSSRNTAENWANNAWPFLKDLQVSLTKSIAMRAMNRYRFTAVNECFRGMAEYSVGWTTPSEERRMEMALEAISRYASPLDDSLTEYQNRWDDFGFAYYYPDFAIHHQQIPRFVIRPDICADTGEVPPRTGVYMSADDPHATLQFVWTEHGGASLREANTFNEIGLAALAAVGRDALWVDEGKMYDFAMSKPYAERFRDDVFMYGEPYPNLAPSAVARAAFTKRSCKWVFVEIIPDQFQDLVSLTNEPVAPVIVTRRIAGGEQCVKAGFYFTPAAPNSRRYFSAGETTPKLDSSYGITFWQWDANQDE